MELRFSLQITKAVILEEDEAAEVTIKLQWKSREVNSLALGEKEGT